MKSLQVRRQVVILSIVCLLLVSAAGIAAAAVTGDFSATYAGFGDDESSNAPGNEITVQGQIEITGDAAIDPTIIIQGAQWSVLDTGSIEVLTEGDRSLSFDREYRGGELRLSTSEIPADTTLRIEYRTYYTGGADSRSITASEIQFNYDQPSADRTSETFQAEVSLDNRPEDFVEEVNTASQLSLFQRVLSYVGAASIILLIIMLGARLLRDQSPPGGGGPGPG